jgi:protein-disulfide isomerase
MKPRLFFAALAALAALALPAADAAAQRQRRAPARRVVPAAVDWTRTVARTAEGFRMGNPNAALKLVEYGSISCPHCAHFSAEGAPALRDRYVRSGRVSWEYRPYLLFPTDPGLFILLDCLGPRDFFPASEQLYVSQREWIGRLQAVPAEQFERMEGMPPLERSGAMVRAAGLDRFFRQRGMTAARIDACLNDRAGLNRLGEITRRAGAALGVEGTPTFFLNGRKLDANVWAGIEPLLRGR